MKDIKKYMAGLAAAGFVMAMAVPSHAFKSVTIVTESAAATVTGGSAAMTVAVLNVAGNGAAASVAWPAVNAGASWTEASQYLQIVSTLSVAGSGIQTYTNNTLATASPQYTGAVSSSTSAGLVNTTLTTQVIPLAWQIVASNSLTGPVAVDDPNCTGAANQPATCVAPFNGYAWFYYTDEAGGKLANADAGNPYIEVESAGSPPQIQYAQSSFGNSTSYTNNLYLEADFANATGGSTYKTSTLTVELFTN